MFDEALQRRSNLFQAEQAQVRHVAVENDRRDVARLVQPLGIVVAAYAFDAISLWRAGPIALHWPAALFALSGCLMVSRTLKIPKP